MGGESGLGPAEMKGAGGSLSPLPHVPRRRDKRLALKFFEELKMRGLAADVETYNALMAVFAESGDPLIHKVGRAAFLRWRESLFVEGPRVLPSIYLVHPKGMYISLAKPSRQVFPLSNPRPSGVRSLPPHLPKRPVNWLIAKFFLTLDASPGWGHARGGCGFAPDGRGQRA